MSKDISNRLIWLGGTIVNVNDAKINVLSPTAQFGLNVFEGIRCYWNEDQKQLYAFRLLSHFERLQRSLKLLQIDSPYSLSDFKNAFVETIKANDYHEDIAVRQTVFVDGFGTWSSVEPVNMFVSPIPKAKTSAEYNKKGLRCCISSWERINDNSLSPRIKCGANYINSRMGQREALRNGYDTCIFLNEKGKVSEGPGSCLFLIKDGKLITPRLTDSVLESITRDSIIRIAHELLHIDVDERSVDRTELYTCDEAFLCGSAMEITPIFSVDGYSIGSEQGRITENLHRLYLQIATNSIEDKFNWLTPVYE